MRLRVIETLTTAPSFQQIRVRPNATKLGPDGFLAHNGAARFYRSIDFPADTAADSGMSGQIFTVGDSNSFTFITLNSYFNTNGDYMTHGQDIPDGVDTSLPVYFRCKLRSVTNVTTPTFDCRFLVHEAENVLVADPAGGSDLVERAAANTEEITDPDVQRYTETVSFSDTGREVEKIFGPFWIDDYFSGDAIKIRLQLQDDGGSGNFVMTSYALEFPMFSQGKRINEVVS
jgi:hypothetical protein